MIHQESGTTNLQQLASNLVLLLPTPAQWFQLSWEDLIIIPFIMVILRFTLQSFQLNITMNQLQIYTPFQINPLMMMKWTISYNSTIHNIMKTFWVLTSRCFRIDYWLPLLQHFIHYLLCCFIKIEERMLQSQIICHTFLCLSRPRPLQNWLVETQDMPKELELFYFTILNFPLYIQWVQFIIFQVNRPIPYHQVPSNSILAIKKLNMNIFNIVTLLTHKFVLGDHPTKLKTILNIFKLKLLKSNLTETGILLSQLSVQFRNNLSQIIHQNFGHVSITKLKLMARKEFMEVLPENISDLEDVANGVHLRWFKCFSMC